MSKKSLATWEKERGFIFAGNVDLDQQLTEDEFTDMLFNGKTPAIGVDHKERAKFLKNNGYEVNRENMINSDLSTASTEQE